MDMRKKDTFQVKRNPHHTYRRHTDECSGIDWIVIDRIISAGTIDALPAEHVICDCERAYIVYNYKGSDSILKIGGETRARLMELAQTL